MAKKLKPKPLHHHVHRHLKRWFVPHKHNDHRPHLIRGHGLAVVALLIISVQITANFMRPASLRVLAYASDINITDLLNLTNQQRVANGLPAFKLDGRLNQSATLKSQNMFSENYWAHVSPSGIQPWHWFGQAGYVYTYAGENLAKDFDTSSGAVTGWMNSPGHKANILNANYSDVGFSIQNGTLLGGQTTLVVAHYGSTSSSAVAPAKPVAVPKVTAAAKPAATPAATPAPEPSATPTPEPSATPTPTATPVPVAANQNSSAPPPQQYSLFKPLSIIQTLNFGTLLTIFLLIILLIVYAATHITVWRKGLRRWRSLHYRLYASTQVSVLAIAIIMLSVSGFGSVG